MGIQKSVTRQDAVSKVNGSAMYVEDMLPRNALFAVVLHSTIAYGDVISVDCSIAKTMPGVIDVVSCFDIPEFYHATAGHPLSLDPAFADIADRLMLTKNVKHYGDNIAVVVAEDLLSARRAIASINVRYEERKPSFNTNDAAENDPIHPEVFATNDFAGFDFAIHEDKLEGIGRGGMDTFREKAMEGVSDGDISLSEEFDVPPVHACHIETPVCFAYMTGEKLTVVTATQAPHTVCRIVSLVTGHPISKTRVIKPYVGGSFGNKQDVTHETLAAYLSKRNSGKCIAIFMTREESFVNSRTRHGMHFSVKSIFGDDHLKLRECFLDSEQGGYATHGHSIAINAITDYAYSYKSDWCIGESRSVYTNKPCGAAMRGYGIPQICFAIESHMDDLANLLHKDPIELRRQCMINEDYVDPINGNAVRSFGLPDCVKTGEELSKWNEKRAQYSKTNTGNIRRGIGMAMFIYPTGLAPFSLESSACRITLTQDGGACIQVGATELGQGSDTALAQIVSEVLHIPDEKVVTQCMQDTDATPYDNGAYASRQTFITGSAVKQTALLLCDKVLKAAARRYKKEAENFKLTDEGIFDTSTAKICCSLSDMIQFSLFNIADSEQLVAESTFCMHDNAFSFGTCFADIEVDIPLGKLTVKELVMVHDSGTIINPQLAESQVQGGAVMGLGYALTEQLLFDETSGRMLNNNLLDYKIPTAMDIPEIKVAFVQTNEPKGPFGNKSLGEPPILAVAPAVRNALLHATGVGINSLPLTPEKLTKAFLENGLIQKRGD